MNKNLKPKNTMMVEFDRELQRHTNNAEERIGELDRPFEIIQSREQKEKRISKGADGTDETQAKGTICT